LRHDPPAPNPHHIRVIDPKSDTRNGVEKNLSPLPYDPYYYASYSRYSSHPQPYFNPHHHSLIPISPSLNNSLYVIFLSSSPSLPAPSHPSPTQTAASAFPIETAGTPPAPPSAFPPKPTPPPHPPSIPRSL